MNIIIFLFHNAKSVAMKSANLGMKIGDMHLKNVLQGFIKSEFQVGKEIEICF